nr:serine/threonine-protein phosphatase 7 long form like [Quercus suber]
MARAKRMIERPSVSYEVELAERESSAEQSIEAEANDTACLLADQLSKESEKKKDLLLSTFIPITFTKEVGESSLSSGEPSKHYTLGPAFVGPAPNKFLQYFPSCKNGSPLYQTTYFDWGVWNNIISIASWYHCDQTWSAWVSRMHAILKDKWVDLGICEAICSSQFEMPLNQPLIAALLLFWSPMTNTFHFPEGFMTITIADVVSMLGLSAIGDVPYPGYSPSGVESYHCPTKGSDLGYQAFLKREVRYDDEITFQEECSFYLYWICKFLVCNPSKRILQQFVPLAVALAKRKKLALAPYFVANLYRALYSLTGENLSKSIGGPLWFLQIWAYAYFPILAPIITDYGKSKPINYAQMWMEARYEKGITPTFKRCFEVFFDIHRSRLDFNFMPFFERKFGSKEFLIMSSTMEEPDDMIQQVWGSCLFSRELITYGVKKAGTEIYAPSLVARQFGLVQSIPAPPKWTINDPWNTRIQVQGNILETLAADCEGAVTRFKFRHFQQLPKATDTFNTWWATYMASKNDPGIMKQAVRNHCPAFALEETLGDVITTSYQEPSEGDNLKGFTVLSPVPLQQVSPRRSLRRKQVDAKRKLQVEEEVDAERRTKKNNVTEIEADLLKLVEMQAEVDKQIAALKKVKNEFEEEHRRGIDATLGREPLALDQPDVGLSTPLDSLGSYSKEPLPFSTEAGTLNYLLKQAKLTCLTLYEPSNSSSSASGATSEPSQERLEEALVDLNSCFSLGIEKVLLNTEVLNKFKSSSKILLQHRFFLSEIRQSVLRLFCNNLANTTKHLKLKQKKEKECIELRNQHKRLIETRETYKLQLNVLVEQISEKVKRKEQMEQELMVLNAEITEAQSKLHHLQTQKATVCEELSELPKTEKTLERQLRDISKYEEYVEDGWRVLLSIFDFSP